MECSEFKRKLSRFLDGKLSTADEALVRKHLKDCRTCGRYLESISRMVGVMSKKGKDAERKDAPRKSYRPKSVLKLVFPLIFIGLILVTFGISQSENTMKPVEGKPHPLKLLEKVEKPAEEKGLPQNNTVKTDPASSQTLPKKSSPESPPAPVKKVVVENLESGNLIARNRDQKWLMHVPGAKRLEQNIDAVLKEFDITEKSSQEIKTGGNGFIYTFTVPYGELIPLMNGLEKIAGLEKKTPLPVVKGGAYINARGGVNTLVLQEKIHVELTVEE